MSSSDTVVARLQAWLESSPYACERLTPLVGGTINYIYWGELRRHLPTTPPTAKVVVKHAEYCIASVPALDFPISRIQYEHLNLDILSSWLPTVAHDIQLSIPCVYAYLGETNTLIQNDARHSISLQDFIFIPKGSAPDATAHMSADHFYPSFNVY